MKSKKVTLKFPCLYINQSGYKLYCFAAKAQILWEIVKINRRDPDKDEGYQRALSGSRVVAITNYIKDENPIPNSILVALDMDSEISSDGKTIMIPKREDAGWVIDGQHRLAGAKKSDIDLFVIAFIGLDLNQQIRQFVVINREAKGVPTSLYYDLLKHLPLKSESEMAKEIAADIANILRKDENSLFFNRIVISAPRKGQLSLTNFVRKISPLVTDKKGKFNIYTRLEQIRILDNYFKAFENVFPKEFFEKRMTFFRTLGFGAVINALPTIFDLSLKHYLGFRIDDIVEVLKKIEYFDFSDWEKMGTGTAAETQAGEDLRFEVLEMFKTTEEDIGSVKLE